MRVIGPRTGDLPIVSDICNKKVLTKLTAMFPHAGALYIISNPWWKEETVLKIGKTKVNDLKRRFHNYNTTNPGDIVPKLIVICKDVDQLEDHVKLSIGPFLIDDSRL
jgi:hypothetical protein